MESKTKKDKPFRVSAKNIFLTYSDLSMDVTEDPLVELINTEVPDSQYVIGTEFHKSGSSKHFHVVIMSPTKLKKRSCDRFSFEYAGKVRRCHIQGAKSLKKVIAYTCKDEEYTSNIRNLYEGKLLTIEQLIRRMMKREGPQRTLEYYAEHYPKEALGGKSLARVRMHLKELEDLKRGNILVREKAIAMPFKTSDFNLTSVIKKWIESDHQPTLFLVGPAGCGKTQFIKAMASEKGWNVLRISHKEGLKYLTSEHDALICEELSLQDLDDQAFLALLETQDATLIRILHTIVEKKPGLVQIFAFNKTPFLELAHWFNRYEFARRCMIVQVPSDFINNRNITNNYQLNQINVHNHIYNNPDTVKANQQAQ